MANKKIWELPSWTPSGNTSNNTIPIDNNFVTQKISLSAITEYVQNNITLTGITFEDITYDNLYNKISNSELIPKQWYKITDFQTKYQLVSITYNQEGYLYPIENDLKSGPIEPLIVQAISNNEISYEAYSETYPQDLIYYKIYDPFSEFGRPITWDITFENLPVSYYSGTYNFELRDPFDNYYLTVLSIEFDSSGNVINITQLPPYLKNNYQYTLIDGNGVKGQFTPTSTQYFGGDKGYITRRIDRKSNISIPGDWRHIKYRRWAAELITVSSITGDFFIGEYVQGQTSGTYGVITSESGGKFAIKRHSSFYQPTFGGSFQIGEIIVGQKSGAQGTIDNVEIDESYSWGSSSQPANPGEVFSIDFNYLDNPNVFPIAGYANQTIIFNQDSTNGSGIGLQIEVTFDSSGFVTNSNILDGGQNYSNYDLVETDDQGSGKLYLLISGLKSCELYAGINVYVVSGTALYNGVQYTSGQTFTPLLDPSGSNNPVEFFQQVGSTPLLVKKPFYGVCFDNGLPYKDLPILNEKKLELEATRDVTFNSIIGGDFFTFQGQIITRDLTYLGTVIVDRAIGVDIGQMLDCSVSNMLYVNSTDNSLQGRIYGSVFANPDAGINDLIFDKALADLICCHYCSQGTLKLGTANNLITSNSCDFVGTEFNYLTNTTFGTKIGQFLNYSYNLFKGNMNDCFFVGGAIRNIINADLQSCNFYGSVTDNKIQGNLILCDFSGQTVNNTISGYILRLKSYGNYFSNNNLNLQCNDFVTYNNFTFNNILVENISDSSITGETKYNVINCENFTNNNIYGDLSYNTINSNFNNNTTTIDNFQRNKIETDISSIDFSTATHVYQPYNCTIFENSGGNKRLSYYDASDVLNITNINV